MPTLEPLESTGRCWQCSLAFPLSSPTLFSSFAHVGRVHLPADTLAAHASALSLLLGKASFVRKQSASDAAQGSWEHFEIVHLHRNLGASPADQGLSSSVQQERGGLYPRSRVSQGMQGWVHSGGSVSMY